MKNGGRGKCSGLRKNFLRILFDASQALVGAQAVPGVSLRLFVQLVGRLRERPLQGRIAHLSLEEFLELTEIRLFGIQGEGILVRANQLRIVAVIYPVACLHRFLCLRMALAHTGFDPMVDTGSVGNDEEGPG